MKNKIVLILLLSVLNGMQGISSDEEYDVSSSEIHSPSKYKTSRMIRRKAAADAMALYDKEGFSDGEKAVYDRKLKQENKAKTIKRREQRKRKNSGNLD